MVVLADYEPDINERTGDPNNGKYSTHCLDCVADPQDWTVRPDWNLADCCNPSGPHACNCLPDDVVLPKLVDKDINIVFGKLKTRTDEMCTSFANTLQTVQT